MDISFTKESVSWEGIEIPMRDFNKLRKWKISKMEMKAIIQESSEPIVTQEATERILKILDSKYEIYKFEIGCQWRQTFHANR